MTPLNPQALARQILQRAPAAHVVPLTGKTPVGKWGKEGWRLDTPWPAAADAIGIVPASVDLVVIDLDSGPRGALRDFLMSKLGVPVVDYPSAKGHHFLARATGSFKNSRWELQNADAEVVASGDIRSAAGYAKIYSEEGILAALDLPSEAPQTRAVLHALGARRRPAGERNAAANTEAYRDPLTTFQTFAAAVADGLEPAEAHRAAANGQQAGWALRMAAQKRDLRMVQEIDGSDGKTTKLYSERGAAYDWMVAMDPGAGGAAPAYWLERDEQWIVYRDGRWQVLDKGQRPAYMGLAWSDMVDALTRAGRLEIVDRERLTPMAKTRSVIEALADLRAIDPAEFDADPALAGLPDGSALDVTTGQILPADPGRLISRALACTPDATCPTPKFDAYLRQALPEAEVREWLRAFARYSLTGYVDRELAAILRGPPGTGKGTFLEVMRTIAGDYEGTMLPEHVETQSSPPHPEWLLEFNINRAVFVADLTPKRPWNTGLLQQVISGEMTRGRGMFAAAASFKPTAKLWIASNDVPRAQGNAGIWRRLAVIGFDVKPEQPDRTLKATIIEHELPGVLAWILGGDMERLDTIPASMAVKAAADREANRPLLDALDEISVEEEGAYLIIDKALAILSERRHVPASTTVAVFSKSLREEGIEPVRRLVDTETGKRQKRVIPGRKLTTF